MSGDRVSVAFAIQTADGVRVPDVIWISKARRAPYGRTIVLPSAPDPVAASLLCPEFPGQIELD